MRSHKVDLCLWDGSHSDLVKGTGEESSKRAAENDVPVPAPETDSYPAEVLLSDEALNVALREGFLVGEGEGGVFGVSVQSYDAIKVLSQLHKSIAIGLTSGNLCKCKYYSD